MMKRKPAKKSAASLRADGVGAAGSVRGLGLAKSEVSTHRAHEETTPALSRSAAISSGGRIGASVAPRGERALDARTLYLAAAEPLRVTSTGEALVISRVTGQPNGQVQRVPISRVLRIVCTTSAEWSGAALSLCLQQGVCISWIDGCGDSLGHLWPQRARQIDLASALNVLAGDAHDWAEQYANWLRSQRLNVLKHWGATCAAAGKPVADAEWQQAKRLWVYQQHVPEHLPTLLHGMAAALVVSRLSDHGLEPRYWCSVGEPIELAQDLTRLVWAEMNLCSGALADAIDHPQEAAAIFERWSGTCAGAFNAHIASLRAHALRQLHA